ncbi:Pro-Pol poly, partial [Brachionus plicatilis]
METESSSNLSTSISENQNDDEQIVVENVPCTIHFQENGLLKEEAIDEIPIYKNVTTMKKDEVKILLESLRVTSSKSLFDQLRDIKTVPETTCLNFTGFTKDELFFIKNELKSLYDTENRTKVQAVFIYLFWLRKGLDQTTISEIFQLKYRQLVSNICEQVRSAVLKDFVPKNLRANHLTRDDWLLQNTEMVAELFDLNSSQL